MKVWNFLYVLSVSKKKIDGILKETREHVERKNRENLEYYKERIAVQEFYRIYAPTHMKELRFCQKNIISYLDKIGYMNSLDIKENKEFMEKV